MPPPSSDSRHELPALYPHTACFSVDPELMSRIPMMVMLTYQSWDVIR